MSSRTGRVAARGVAIALPGLGAIVGLAAPTDLLWGGLAWLGFLVAALAGWGHAVERATRGEVDLGLRLAWGTALLLAVAGGLLALGALDRTALLALAGVGYAGYAWRQATVAEPVLPRLGRALAALRHDPQAAILWAAMTGLGAALVLGAVVRVHGNAYDDDIAYTPLVRRLLETGDLDEPFGLRRLSAYGGQTVLAALGAARGTLAAIFLVDHGVFRIVTLALLIGMLRRPDRRGDGAVAERTRDHFVTGLIILVVLLLPDASTNTASYWTGAALFLGLYRTAVALDGLPRAGFATLGLATAAACSLRQNFVPVAVLFTLLVLLLRLRRPLATAWREERAAWRDTVVAGAVVLVPFMIAAWRSSQTPLYPLWPGTANPDIPTTPVVWSAWQELQFFLQIVLDPNPVRVAVPLLPVLLLCRDRRRGAPLLALCLACGIGFVALVHAFPLSDARNLWRYAFGFMTVLALALVVEAAGRGMRADAAASSDDDVTAPATARVMIVVCLLLQLAFSLKSTRNDLRNLGADLAAARGHEPRGESTVAALYRRAQAAVPVGAPLVALLDEPAHLDYARNPIANLDTPGAASPGPGLPMFTGAEAKAAYFRARGLRYLVFVRGDHSRYFYRRAQWLDRLFWENELWRVVAAYQLDTSDSFAELATRYPVRFDEDGVVVLDLAAPVAGAPPPPAPQAAAGSRRAALEAHVEALATREGLTARWRLMSRGDVVFEDGWSRPVLVVTGADGRWTEVAATTPSAPAVPVRWIGRSAHARVHGSGDMRLRLWGRVDVAATFTRPRVTVSVAGRELTSRIVEPDGEFLLDAVVPAAALGGWRDLFLTLSSGDELRRDPARLKVARVEGLTWEPAR